MRLWGIYIDPHYALLFAAFLCLMYGAFGSAKMPLQVERRRYWKGTLCASLLGALAGFPQVKMMIFFPVFVFCAQVFFAYIDTPFIRIRGKIYAFEPYHKNAETPGANDGLSLYDKIATPAKHWWLIAAFCVIFGFEMLGPFLPGQLGMRMAYDKTLIFLTLSFCLSLALGHGYAGARNGYPIAQRQWIQFCIASVSSLGLFTAVYLVAYYFTSWMLNRPVDGREIR